MQKIDVCLISETHITNQSYMRFRSYKFYHTIHLDIQAKEGSAVIIKDTINHHEGYHLQRADMQLRLMNSKTEKQHITVGAVTVYLSTT